MRVLLSPGAEQAAGAAWAAALAGDDLEVVRLTGVAVRTVRRRLSQAEVHAIRKALLGLGPGDQLESASVRASEETPTVGYVCAGRASTAMVSTDGGVSIQPASADLLAVTDHANLTWRSPLVGPNDDLLGPRFPVVAGVYRPEVVVAYWESSDVDDPVSRRGRPVATGVVAEVRDDGRLSAFEQSIVQQHSFPVVSSELAGVAILAAHLGLKLAAGVVVV